MCARKKNQDHKKYYHFSVQKPIRQKAEKVEEICWPLGGRAPRLVQAVGALPFHTNLYSTWSPTTHKRFLPLPHGQNSWIKGSDIENLGLNIFFRFPDAVLKPTHTSSGWPLSYCFEVVWNQIFYLKTRMSCHNYLSWGNRLKRHGVLYRRGISQGKNIAVTMSRNRICMLPMRHLAYTQESSSFFPIGGGGRGGAKMGFFF